MFLLGSVKQLNNLLETSQKPFSGTYARNVVTVT